MDARQLKEIIISPVLTALGMNSPSAVNLLLGTAAQETKMGKYIKQIKGPALGIYQMEPLTYRYLWDVRIEKSVPMRAKIKLMLGYSTRPPAERMASDLMLATLMSRLHYYYVPESLPDKDDIMGLATYWKTHYNTRLGDGTIQEFIDAYYRYVKASIP